MSSGDHGEQPPPYGQPPGYGYVAPTGGYGTPQPRLALGAVGIGFAAAGAVLGIVSFLGVDWYGGGFTGGLDFGQIHDNIDAGGVAVARVYFDWLAWLLFAAAFACGVVANLPTPVNAAFRVIGALLGAAGLALTFVAVRLDNGASYQEYIKHARVGFYLAAGAFLLIAVGALIGPRRIT